VGSGDPVFHSLDRATGPAHEPARLSRVGADSGSKSDSERRPAVVALCGPNAWIWSYGPDASEVRDAFWVIDARDW
jgi:hypothetical protein